MKMKLQENHGNFFLTIPKSQIEFLEWKKGDTIIPDADILRKEITLKKG